jgi:hypothetical protein
MRPIRKRLKTWLDAWVLKRQGKDSDPVMFEPRRQYILPTRMGVGYSTMVIVMAIGGLNYSNNLALGFSFMLASLGFVSMFHTHAALAKLGLKLEGVDPVFAGDTLQFRLTVFNRGSLPRPRIELFFENKVLDIVDVPANNSAILKLKIETQKRGWVRVQRLELASHFPLGLFRTWVVVHPSYQCLVWPKPAGALEPCFSAEANENSLSDNSTKEGGDEFFGLRTYHPGDSPSRIAWKTFARQQGLFIKQYGEPTVPSRLYDYEQLGSLSHEDRLSQLARWVLDSKHRGEFFGVKTPWGSTSSSEGGPLQLERCLNLLASAP